MKHEKIYMEEITEELFDQERPETKHEYDYENQKKAYHEYLQRKKFNRILAGLEIDNSLSDRLRGEKKKYQFNKRFKPFIKRILSKEYSGRILNQIDPNKKNRLPEKEIIKIIHNFYKLHLDVGYSESEAKKHMAQAMTILNYEECKKKNGSKV